MAANGYSVTIQAVDNASKYIKQVNAEIARMRGPIDRVQREMARFGDLTGITKLGRGIRSLGQHAMGAFQSLGQILAPLGALTGAASIAGVFRLVSAWAEFGTTLGNNALLIGTSAEHLHALQGAAALSGSSAGALTSGLETLSQTLYDAVGGRAPQAVVMLNTLGIAFRDTSGHARSVDAVMPEVADKIAALHDPMDQLRVATTLFGGSARDLLPFLRRGSQGIAEYNKMAEHYGVINENAAAAARRLQFEQAKLTLSAQGFSNSISEALAPAMGDLMGEFAELIAANRTWIAQDVGRYAKQFSDYLHGIDWKHHIDQIETLASQTNSAVQAFGGWKSVIEGIIGLKLLGWVTSILGPLATLVRLLSYIPGSGVVASTITLSGDTPGTPSPNAVSRSDAQKRVDEINQRQGYTGDLWHDLGQGLRNGLSHLGLGEPASANQPGPSSGPLPADVGARASRAIDYFRGQGWSPQQAAALAGNIRGESGFDPGARGDNGTAVGLGQWHPGRVAAIQAGTGIDVRNADFEHQLQAMQWELSNSEARAGMALHTANTVSGATGVLVTQYERSANQSADVAIRSRYAQDLYDNHIAASPPETAVSLAPNPSEAPMNIGSGAGAPPADVTHTVKGQANVNLNLGSGFPPGTTVNTNTSGDLFQGAPQIHRSMAGAG